MKKEIPSNVLAYLKGETLSTDVVKEVETLLKNDIELFEAAVERIGDNTPSSDLQIGINLQGEKELKAQLSIVEQELESEGFFFNHNDIHAYLNGTMKEEQVDLFENRLANDKAFAEKVARETSILEGIQQVGEQNTRAELKKVEGELEQEGFFDTKEKQEKTGRVISLFGRRAMAIAASIALLIGAYFFWDINGNFSSTNNLVAYEDVLTPEIDKEIVNPGFASDEEQLKALKECMKLYKAKQYEKAIPDFEQHLNKYPDELEAPLYLGISYLMNNQNTKAKNSLQKLANSPNTELTDEAQWYLANAHIRLDERDDAKALLQALSNNANASFQQDAKKLLEQLK